MEGEGRGERKGLTWVSLRRSWNCRSSTWSPILILTLSTCLCPLDVTSCSEFDLNPQSNNSLPSASKKRYKKTKKGADLFRPSFAPVGVNALDRFLFLFKLSIAESAAEALLRFSGRLNLAACPNNLGSDFFSQRKWRLATLWRHWKRWNDWGDTDLITSGDGRWEEFVRQRQELSY